MLEKSNNKRETWIDSVKTLLIYFVVVGNVGCKGCSQELLYTFYLFFYIYGWLYYFHDCELVVIAHTLMYP